MSASANRAVPMVTLRTDRYGGMRSILWSVFFCVLASGALSVGADAARGLRINEIYQDCPGGELNGLGFFASAGAQDLGDQIPAALSFQLRPLTLVEASGAWRFFRGKAEPSGGTLQWTEPSFDDSAWEEGPGGFGYGDNDDATVLSDMLNTYTTVYIRREFFLGDPSSVGEVTIEVDFDDGFIAYLNGTEVARANVPGEKGAPVPFDATASASHEAGTAISFPIADPQSLLQAGENVLAVQGLNQSVDSSDFSLKVSLGTGAVVDSECGDRIYVSGAQLAVVGVAPVPGTEEVRVNGQAVFFDNVSGSFSGTVRVVRGEFAVAVEAIDPDGLVVESAALTCVGVTTLGGELPEDTTLSADRSPYFVGGMLTVPAGVTLQVEPGCTFVMDERGRIVVRGCIQALGTEEQPIRFERKPCIDYWAGISLEGTRQDNCFLWCRLSGIAAIGAVYARSSKLTLDSCVITRIDGEGLYTPGCDIHVYNTEISYTREAISADDCRPAVFEYLYVHSLFGKADCVDPNGCHPAYIRYCLLERTSDDGIDADRGTVEAIGNEIRNCGDQAVSLAGGGQSYLAFNVFHHCTYGVALKDSHRALLDHNTIVDNRAAGIRLYEKTAGRGGGHAAVKSCIVYFNGQAHTADEKSSITYDWCDVEHDPVPEGEGNFNEDPLFVDRASGNYELTAASPCIGAGENSTDVGALPFASMPLAPADLTVTGTTPSSISLAWRDVAVNEDGFELQRKEAEGEFTTRAILAAGTTSYTDEGLAAGVVYTYRVRAFSDAGYSDWSNEASGEPGTVPQAPGKLIVTAVTVDAISLAWQDNSEDETGFEIQRWGPEDAQWVVRATVPADVTTYTDADPPLRGGSTYRYRLRAYNSRGFSGWSNEVSQRTGRLPEAPADLTVASFTTDSITITWEDRSDNETSFAVEVKIGQGGVWQPRVRLGPGRTQYEDTGLLSGEVYSYRVRAENESGVSAWAGPVAQQTASVPAVPGDCSVADVGLTWILLAWEDKGDQETGYEIERASEGGTFEALATLAAGTTQFADSGLPPDTLFRYRLRAVNQWGASPWSEVIEGRTGHLPQAPAELRVTDVHLTFLALAWDDLSDNEEGFVLERKVEGGAYVRLVRLPADWTSYTDHGLSEGTEYSYRIKAVNRFGSSAWSNEVTALTGALPPAPAGLHVREVGLTYVELAWEDRAGDELYFEVEYRTEGDSEWRNAGSAGAGSAEFRARNLRSATTYLFRVRAWNRFGPSPYSEEVSARTGSLPLPPSLLEEADWSGSHISLTWVDNASGETAYVVQRQGEEQEDFETVAELPPDSTSWIDTQVTEGKVYRYAVRAQNAFGLSEPSNILSTCAGVKLLLITPTVGAVQGGDRVRLEGYHLRAEARITVGGRELTDVTQASGAVEGTTGESPRARTVDVVLQDGAYSSVLPQAFHYARGLLRGDANGNRYLSLADAVMLLSYLFRSGPPPYCPALGDANADTFVDLADVMYLLEYLFGSGPPPAPEQVDCR